ncbi:MAG: hypothetical protein U9R39_00990 [Campylobacterota bacterium]|nr:hypothetical protein [Campylobacterota bacterium]
MDTVLILLILALIVVAVLIFLNGNSTNNAKSSVVKKHEIIEQYEKELKAILDKHKHNNETKIEQKKLFLQKCSSELSRNIFFDPEESKQVIQKLASL